MKKPQTTTIVVRKSANHKHGHHGGSWKIAYADFMTAMMAFFLVMWLLSTSTPEQRGQIAEYFKMPLKTTLAQGDKSSLSSSIVPGGGDDVIKQDGEVLKNTLKKLDEYKSETNLKRAQKKLENLIETDPRLNNFKSNLRLSLTENGMLLQITDSPDRPMFQIGRPAPESYMVSILQALVPVLNDLPNRIVIIGHTDSLPYAKGELGYSNWELSSDRANASRRILVNAGLAERKFMRVIGMAETQMQPGTRPDDPLNRRISILVLSKEKENQTLQEDVILHETTADAPAGGASIMLQNQNAAENTPLPVIAPEVN